MRGARRADDLLGVEVAHDRELAQVLGLGVDVGADVEQHGAAAAVGEDRGQGRAVDARRCVPITILAAIIAAPVLPAVTIACGAALAHQLGAEARSRSGASCGSA